MNIATQLLATAIPQSAVLLLSVASGILVGAMVFVFLYLRARPPKPIERIAVVKGPAAGVGVAVKGRVRIGRDEENDLTLEDDEVSRFHCEVRGDTGVTVLIDMQSANGTRVNGKTVQSSVLRAGDEITIGRHLLRCS